MPQFIRPYQLIAHFMRASLQEELAYRSNFTISLFYSLLNMATGVLGVMVLFGQIQEVRGWDFAATLALLGVYLSVGALRALFIGPGLEALAGMDGEIWPGRFDFTLLRRVNTQILVSLRKWRIYALLDLLLGIGVLATAIAQPGLSLNAGWQVPRRVRPRGGQQAQGGKHRCGRLARLTRGDVGDPRAAR